MGRLFGTDGIRGLAGQDPITQQMGRKLGQAVVLFCRQRGNRPIVVIGRDTRASGNMLEFAVVSGVLSAGGQAYQTGVLPTPGVAFLTKELCGGAGIVISASHNSFEYNGFKVFSHEGFKLSMDEEDEIEDLILSKAGLPFNRDHGQAEIVRDSCDRYVSFLRESLPENCTFKDMKIVLDCSNGATFQVAPALFQVLDGMIEALFVAPDGKNINRNCGSQHTDALRQRVLEEGADAGLAFDGDGDRLVAIDEKGYVLTGDRILTICAKMLRERGLLKNNLVVSTVMSNTGLRPALKNLGIKHISTQVGDRHVLEEMMRQNANLGGEDSGHIIFLDYHTTGDGLLSALQLLFAIKAFGIQVSELSTLMKPFPQTLINVPVKTKPDISEVPELPDVIRRVEQHLDDRGRVLVRYSGTEPVFRVMVEGEKKEKVEDFAREIAEAVKRNID